MNSEISTPIAGAVRRTRVALLAYPMLVLSLALVLCAVSASAQDQIYVVTSNQQFGTVNLGTGAFRQIGANTPEGQANLVWGPEGVLFSLTYSGNLEKIDPATGATTVVGPTGLGLNAFDLAGVRGKLYATDFSNNIYSVDSKTGAAVFLSATGMPPDPAIPFTFNSDGTMNLCDESFYGIGGRLYAIFDAFTLNLETLAKNPAVQPALYQIDPSTGVAKSVASTDLNLGTIVEVDGRVYAFKWDTTAFTDFGPQVQSLALSLDLSTGRTGFVAAIDPAAGGITGAAPIRSRRWAQ